jgi:hypothetical protein
MPEIYTLRLALGTSKFPSKNAPPELDGELQCYENSALIVKRGAT